MNLPPGLVKATFMERSNRFAALVACEGREVSTHVANSGRLKELLRPENPMYLSPAPTGTGRKTAFDLVLVDVNGILVSADARLPNGLVREAIEAGRLAAFRGYNSIRPEVALEESRIDLLLSGDPGLCYIEVKSVTLVEDEEGLFPDAPTDRGRKHLMTLEKAVSRGHRGAVVFVIQRPDAQGFSPNRTADPLFSNALSSASMHGVEIYAYRCDVRHTRITISDAVPVSL